MKLKITRGKSKGQLRREVTYYADQLARYDDAARDTFKDGWRELTSQKSRRSLLDSEDRKVMDGYYRGWEKCLEFLQPRITGVEDMDEL